MNFDLINKEVAKATKNMKDKFSELEKSIDKLPEDEKLKMRKVVNTFKTAYKNNDIEGLQKLAKECLKTSQGL